MSKKVTESPEELITAGNGNANSLISLSNDSTRFNERSRGDVGVLAQQMAEKFLKAYLKNNQKTKDVVDHGHDLRLYLEQAKQLDNSFTKLYNDIDVLNDCNSEIRYNGMIKIDKEDFVKVLTSVKNIYTFPIFKELVNKFDKKYGAYPDEDFDKIIEKHSILANKTEREDEKKDSTENVNNKEIYCKKYQLIDMRVSNAFENMKLDPEEKYGDRLSKYSKETDEKKYYFLCRNVERNKKEIFQISRDVSKNEAVVFIEQWDEQQKNKIKLVNKNKRGNGVNDDTGNNRADSGGR